MPQENLPLFGASRESEEQFRALIEDSSDIILVLDREGSICYASPSVARLLGYGPQAVRGTRVFRYVHPDDAETVKDAWAEILKGQVVDPTVVCRVQHSDGSWRTVEVNANNLLASAAVQGVVVTARDVTERAEAADALRVTKERYDLATRAARVGVWDWNVATGEFYLDPNVKAILGYTDDEIPNDLDTWVTYVHPDDSVAVMEAAQAHLDGRTPEYVFEHRMMHKDGSIRWIMVRGLAMRDEQGNVVRMVGTDADITERKHLEEQLRETRKLEAVGKLAGGIAHEFNNILMGVMGLTQFAAEKVSGTDAAEDVAEIRKLADRAASLVRKLLAFSRKQPMVRVVLDLNELITGTCGMLRSLIGEHIQLEQVLDPDLGWVRADSAQIEEVLVNLAVNARDAMPQGGTLTVETANVTLDGSYVREHADVAPGPYVMLLMSDTGCGMDEETLRNLFEPFYTTKDVGQGTGLGLAFVHGIVAQHGGHITVSSQPARGTTFRIYLPRVEAEAPPVAIDSPRDSIQRGTETLLVVEDEGAVLSVLRRNLEKLGYEVLAAAGPDEAERMFERRRDDIALLLTDVIMPGRSGRDLYERLSTVRPDLKVLYMSGYDAETHGIRLSEEPFIAKPVDNAALSRKIREILGAS